MIFERREVSKIDCMQMINTDRRMQIGIILLLGLVLIGIYGSNIKNINTVWELADEAGYLCNAAYLSGTDWSDVATTIPYYGYGYSIVLIPLFFLCKNGVQLIRGAICINIICVFILYFLQIYVISAMFKKLEKAVIALFSFLVCLQPYLMGNSFNVRCESFLTMWLWLIAELLIITLKNQKIINYSFLALATVFIFFIHTRAIIVAGVVWIILLGLTLKKDISIKNIICYSIIFVVGFLLLFKLKKSIITTSMHLVVDDSTTNTNLLSVDYIRQRIQWLLVDYKLYIIAFCSKILYLIFSTGGMILYGFKEMVYQIRDTYINKNIIKNATCVYLFLCFVFMMMACTLNGVGDADNFAYLFYGRYYEYTISVFIFMGLYSAVYVEKNNMEIINILVTIFTGIVTGLAGRIFLTSDEIHVDVCRIPGFSSLVPQDGSFNTLVLHCVMCSALALSITYFLRSKNKLKVLIPAIIFVLFINIDSKSVDVIKDINEKAHGDVGVAEYILEHSDKEVNFVDSNYKYEGYYSRMQVLIKDKKLKVIPNQDMSQIDKGTYFITYMSSELGKKYENEGKLVKKGAVFGVYQN